MSGLSITIHNVHPVNAGMVCSLAAWGNGEDVCKRDLIDALSCGLENADIEFIINECRDTYSDRRLAATLAFFDSYSEKPTD